MVVSSEVAGLAMSVVSGAVRLGKELDEVAAEEAAARSPLSLPFFDMVKPPTLGAMSKALKAHVAEVGDALSQAERNRIKAATQGPVERDKLFRLCEKHSLLDGISLEVFSPDAQYASALRSRSAAWDLDDQDIRRLTYFAGAGTDLRNNSLGFRIGATVLDVVLEVAAENTRFLTDHEPTRELLESVMREFASPELAKMDGWGALLTQALRSTLYAVLDRRDQIAAGNELLGRALSALARTREKAGDDFVVGLLRGTGFESLAASLLEEGADYLSQDEENVWESVLADMLSSAAVKAKASRSFEVFFQESWHVVVGAGLVSLREHGPKLLDDDDAILRSALTATVGALADSFSEGPPDLRTLESAVQATIGVFADPDVLAPALREDWVRELIASVAGTVRDKGLATTFTRGALEGYARDALGVLARYPEVLGRTGNEPGNLLVNELLSAVLGRMSKVDTFAVGPLADAAVGAALSAIAVNAGLIDTEYAGLIGELAGGLAERVANGGLAGIQAEALITTVAEVVAANEFLFLEARDGLAEAVVEALLDAAADDENLLLAGAALLEAAERALLVVARLGKGLPASAQLVQERVQAILSGALSLAADEIGAQLSQSRIPMLVGVLVERLSDGIDIPTPGTPAFEQFFKDLLQELGPLLTE